MKNKMQRLLIVAALLLSTPVICGAGKIHAMSESDFAYKAVLGTQASTPFYELEIPEIVYKQVSRDDLGDIRVLNGAGNVVPHGFRHIAPEQLKKLHTESVPYFPLYEKEGVVSDGLHLNIQRSGSGEVIDIQSSREEHSANDRLMGYLLDLSQWKQSIDAIKLSWNVTKDSSFIRQVNISVSEDLSNWTSVSDNKTLVNLSYQNQTLIEDTLNLSIAKAKYLRILYTDNKPALEITNFTVSNTQSANKIKHHWKKVVVSQFSEADKTSAGAYYFKHELKTALIKLRIKLPEINTVVKVTVLSKSTKESTWRSRGTTLLYRLSVDGVEIQQTDIPITTSRDVDWKLQVDQQGGGLGEGLPEVEIAWLPQQLVFVARGEVPYTLVWGSARVSPVTQDARQILVGVNQSNNDSMISNAVWMPDTMSPVNLSSLDVPDRPVNWRQLFLWSVLIAAALLLIWMAVRLMGKMSE